MNLRPKFLAHMLIFSIVIIILIQPAILIGVQNLTPKEAYPNGSLVITQPPSANYPQDLSYCYHGQSTITVSVVFYNTPEGNSGWMQNAITEFSNANITLSIIAYHYDNESVQSYYDFEFENKLVGYRNSDSANIVVSFAGLEPMPQESYGSLAGYSRVHTHVSIACMPNLQTSWAQYIIVHEIAHLLGYFPEPNGHSSNPSSIMYSVYSGSNNHFDANDLNILSGLHTGA